MIWTYKTAAYYSIDKNIMQFYNNPIITVGKRLPID